MQAGGWTIDILLQGYPGKSATHGGLGWCTVALLRGHGHVALLDTGGFGVRGLLPERLGKLGLAPSDVTDLLLSHLHFDHIVNWPMFDRARMATGAVEMAWARAEPAGVTPVAELYVEGLHRHERMRLIEDGETVLPGITAHLTPGHTPGHLAFVVEGEAHDVLLVQDAAKYRCELLTGAADMTYDPAVTRATIAAIWSMWRRKQGSVLVPGHDRPMVLEGETPVALGEREADLFAFFGARLEERTRFDLSGRTR